jgi:MinD-like ATPase involved in chromosome partitioning or flagellar assembly
VEVGAVIARSGRDVAIVDAAYETQGLSDYVEGPIEADVTELVTDGAAIDEVVHPVGLETPGQLSLCPTRAPFERLARAKTAAAAEQLEKQVAAIALSHDAVLVDTPPVASNQAVAAVDAADRVVAVTPDTARGADALSRLRGRIDDVGTALDAVVATFADGYVEAADGRVPRSDTEDATATPVAAEGTGQFTQAVAETAAVVIDEEIDAAVDDGGRLSGFLGG